MRLDEKKDFEKKTAFTFKIASIQKCCLSPAVKTATTFLCGTEFKVRYALVGKVGEGEGERGGERWGRDADSRAKIIHCSLFYQHQG